jgi:uncharacterized protein (TIGR01244 family)
VRADVTGVGNLVAVDDRVWRGAAPGRAGYESLARAGVTTVVDLRAEDDAAELDDAARAAGLTVVHLPVRDGQLPSADQITRFEQIVSGSPGTVFLHCGAGVGRTGAMAAAHLVGNGDTSALTALARNLAVGPPSLEQMLFVADLGRSGADRPPAALVAVSRVLDAPRRLWSVLS